LIDEEFEAKLETKISYYLTNNITFVCFPIHDSIERLRLKEGIIETFNSDDAFGPSSNWLDLNSPKPEIANAGL